MSAHVAHAGVAHPRWAPGDISLPALLEGLETRRHSGLTARSPLEIADILGAVGERFTKAGPLRRAALEALVEEPGYSEAMAEAVLDGMACDWSVERLRKLVTSELEPHASASPDPPAQRGRGPNSWAARSPAVHVCAGNVPGVSVTGLIRGLLVRSAVLVKPGRSDCALPVLFHQALEEAAPDLAGTAAVHYWDADAAGVSEVMATAELVVVHGGSAAIRWARRSAGPATHLVEYPHRVSVLLVMPDGLKSDSAQEGARAAALAVALFEQRGCVSPQAIYVVQDAGGASESGAGADGKTGCETGAETGKENGEENGGEVATQSGAEVWADRLATELERLETELPRGRRTPAEASAFHQEAGSAEMAAAAGTGTRVWGSGTGWRVVLEPGGGFRPSCLGRFVRVYANASFEGAARELERLAPQLQTVGIVGSIDRDQRTRLVNAGALRVTGVEDVPWPPAWARLDGIEPLRSLVRWVDGD